MDFFRDEMIALRRKRYATSEPLFFTRPYLAHAQLLYIPVTAALVQPFLYIPVSTELVNPFTSSLCVTHRCHQKESHLKFTKDRKSWRYWLYEAKNRYGLCILDYIVTSNHIHLLVQDNGTGEIAKSMIDRRSYSTGI